MEDLEVDDEFDNIRQFREKNENHQEAQSVMNFFKEHSP